MTKKIDLHGFTVHAGWHEFNRNVSSIYKKGGGELIVVTGNGVMSSEIETWNHHNDLSDKIICIDRYRKGCWKVTIKGKQKGKEQMPMTNMLDAYKYLMKHKDDYRPD